MEIEMHKIEWPKNFPDETTMFELLKKMAKAAWQNESVFSAKDINDWLENFTGEVFDKEDERKLALWMLCNFTYYNENEINHLNRIVYKNFIHDLAKYKNIKAEEDNELQELLNNVYFAAMGKASESGGLILYYFRQQSGLSLKKFYFPTSLPDEEDSILVFIDDVTLSGDTASAFFEEKLKTVKYKKAYCLTLFASNDAIDRIEQTGVKVIYSTILSEHEKCFSENSLVFVTFPNLREHSKLMAESYGKKIYPSWPLGYKNGQYCFGLHYNTPNNTLPIFWADNDWTPIFTRKEKKYKNDTRYKYDRYI